MEIKDLFSHKIHSSGNDWQDKLVELAFIFAEFHGKIFDRDEIERRLVEISPRASYIARDPSKFRDEISAYPAYLGLFRLELDSDGWRIILSETAKKLLVVEEPDVASFMRLQLSLFQYPNGMGAAYSSRSTSVRIQANARDRTLAFIKNGVHLSPLRLICKALMVEGEMRGKTIWEASLTFEEIFSLANAPAVNRCAQPVAGKIEKVIEMIRSGRISAPDHFERRFHILKHTGLFEIQRGKISFTNPENEADAEDLFRKILALSDIDAQFDGFDAARDGSDIERVIQSGAWGTYFDGLRTLSGDVVNTLAADIIDMPLPVTSVKGMVTPIPPSVRAPSAVEATPSTYILKERAETLPAPTPSTRKSELADPEVTKIKRQRRNLQHKLLVDKMHVHLLSLGAKPKENPHVDLYAKIPNDGSYLFEMKSGGANLLDQIRKGVSQLYEYSFRYKDMIDDNPNLCLVVSEEPKEMPWLFEYLCNDRDIGLCWFDGDSLTTKKLFADKIAPLKTPPHA